MSDGFKRGWLGSESSVREREREMVGGWVG